MAKSPQQFALAVNANIKAELVRKNVPDSTVLNMLGISRDSLRRRRAGEQAWQLDEIGIIAGLVDLAPKDLVEIRT